MNLETRSENRTPPVVGRLLRDWRMSRGLSQMDLAEHSGFSARHVSFIETGRTQPSRQALLVLAESLDLPLRERNRLLEAGGFARVFSETPLAANEMAQVRSVLQFILDRHAPYAAVVLDRHSNCLMGNRAAGQIMARLVEPHLLPAGANMLRAVFHPDGMRRWIVNWPEVGGHLLDRAEREMGLDASDAAGALLLEELRGYAGFRNRPIGRHMCGQVICCCRCISEGRARAAAVHDHHDAGHAARRDAAGVEDRNIVSG